ncbi:MAG: fibronectin type III domain-containing protein, partial [Lachnospiraceae bacterium]|nr:fibronectin type III domain-containing protein [Lachnospiraceae bacterium]
CPKNYTVPKPTVLKLKKVAAGQMKITGRTNGEISGYQITYKVGTKKKTLTLAGKSSLSYKVKSLSKGKRVKVRVRCYLVVLGKRMYSSWTAYKKVKV